jgi:hypothetical protein
MLSRVAIYGGFAGGRSESGPAERHGEPGRAQWRSQWRRRAGFANNADNAYHVVRADGVDATGVLDGVTVTGGNADGPNDSSGGGITCNVGNPTLTSCRIIANSAARLGGRVPVGKR